jgi:hypothetical protein
MKRFSLGAMFAGILILAVSAVHAGSPQPDSDGTGYHQQAVADASAASPDTGTGSADASPNLWTAASTPAQPGVFALGVGFPDIRARYDFSTRFDVELKAAGETSTQAYSARLYFRALRWNELGAYAGAESGYLRFDGVYSLDGTGFFAEPFVGAEYFIDKRWFLNVDIGPAFVNVSSDGENIGEWQWTVNTALYYTLF